MMKINATFLYEVIGLDSIALIIIIIYNMKHCSNLTSTAMLAWHQYKLQANEYWVFITTYFPVIYN